MLFTSQNEVESGERKSEICQQQRRIQEFLIGGGGRGGGVGGPNFGSERTVELFNGKLLLPNTPSHQSVAR